MDIDTNTLRFAVREDLTIVGTDPEMADMGNPRGELEGSAHFIMAEASDGRRFAHTATAFTINGCIIEGRDDDEDYENLTSFRVDSSGMTIERLERLAAHLNANHPTLNGARWNEIQASYGSVAYQRDGWEELSISLELDEAVADGDISHQQADSIRFNRGLFS
jgi:hypothetical protein